MAIVEVPCPPGQKRSPLGGCRPTGNGGGMTTRAFGNFRTGSFSPGPGLGIGPGFPTSGPGDPGTGNGPVPGIPELGRDIGQGLGGDLGGLLGGLFGRIGQSFFGPQQGKGCPPGFEKKNGRCVETGIRGTIERTLPGGQTGTLADAMGDPVNGRYGVGVVPSERVTSVLDCPEGMVLGKDNICYEHLRKTERKWPPGRKPLLTGGEMNAITTAARAAKKLHRTKKKLRKAKNALKKVT